MSGSDLLGYLHPDTDEFWTVLSPRTLVLRLHGGFGFVEGPTWSGGDDGFLLFSDIPRNRIHRWSPRDGLSVYLEPSANTNGNSRDRAGMLLSCEHSGRRVATETATGLRSTLVGAFNGHRFNSPNDVVVRSDGTVWFTDPPYGLPSDGAGRELEHNYVFRFDPEDDSIVAVADDYERPNGLCFSPDERRLYIADSGDRRHIRVHDVREDGTIGASSIFCEIDNGVPDGIRCDVEGRVWSSAGDGVHIFNASGERIGRIVTPSAPTRRDPAVIAPETVANLCFGGPGTRLYMTACTSLYAIDVLVNGATQGRTG